MWVAIDSGGGRGRAAPPVRDGPVRFVTDTVYLEIMHLSRVRLRNAPYGLAWFPAMMRQCRHGVATGFARVRPAPLGGQSMRVAFGSLAANAWGRRFLGELSGRLPATLPDRRGVLARTRDAAHRLFDEKRKCGALVNRKARVIYGLCSLVLAAYREVLAGTRDPECAFETVRVAFLHTHQGRVRLMTRVLLWKEAGPTATSPGSGRHPSGPPAHDGT